MVVWKNAERLEKLLANLWDGDPEARDRLRGMGAEAADAVPALTDAVRRDDRRLRLDAMFVLEGIGAGARAAIPALAEALAHGDGEERAAAADTLAAVGADAVAPLVGTLDSDDPAVRQAACRALGAIGREAEQAAPGLLARADDEAENEDVRLRAIWALGEIGDEGVAERLAEILTREGGAIGCWVAEALARFGRRARPVAPALRDELHRDDPYLAVACATALCRMRTFEDSAVWALISLLQDAADPDVRLEAAMALGELGPRGAAAIPALRSAERDGDDELRAQASVAIAKIRPEEAARTEQPTPLTDEANP